jgi:CBS domain containing-hemolysin-like protein
MPVSDVADLLGLEEAPDKDVATVAGLVLSRLDRVPRTGEQVRFGCWRFDIAEMDGARIKRIIARPEAFMNFLYRAASLRLAFLRPPRTYLRSAQLEP